MSRSIPEELIRIKAQTIWEKRQSEGLQGNPENDWIEARQYLEKHRWEVLQWKLSQSLAKRPIKRLADRWETNPIEKFVLEDIKYLLENSAFLSIVTLIAEITIILSLITWITGRKERWEDEIFATWQVVNEASEDQSGVVKIALERLLRNDFSLAGLKLKNTNLWGANLKKANLWGANLQEAELEQANLQEANLGDANLQEANLWGANLQEAELVRANLQEAELEQANLKKANLWGTNLQKAGLGRVNLQEAYLGRANLKEAELVHANLQKANLWGTNLQKAELWGANLQKANLWGANLQKAELELANLQEANLGDANLKEAELVGTKNLTNKQIKSACFWEEAIYKGTYNEEKKNWVAIEPDNTNYIKELKEDTASDPKEPPNCSRWQR